MIWRRQQRVALLPPTRLGAALRHTSEITQKRELVILLKPTVVQNDSTWTQEMLETQRQIQDLDPRTLSDRR